MTCAPQHARIPIPMRTRFSGKSMNLSTGLAVVVCCVLLVFAHEAAAQPPRPFARPWYRPDSPEGILQRREDLREAQDGLRNVTKSFDDFMNKTGRFYPPGSNREEREARYQSVLELVRRSHEDYDNNRSTYWLRITEFADLTPEEFKRTYAGTLPSNSSITIDATRRRRRTLQTLPASVDWRTATFGSAVTPVKDQGSCNSCWAFSTAAAVETSAAINTQTPAVSLSNQQVINCAPTTGGCTTGNTLPGGFSYFVGRGVTTNAQLPYTSNRGAWTQGSGCSPPPPLTNISRFRGVTSANPSQLQSIVATTAVSVAICSTTLQHYGGGLLTTASGCSGCTTVDHAVTVIGYDTTPSGAGDFSSSTRNYWVVKNSWGESWGNGGYALLAMSGGNAAGSGTDRFGPCMILQEPVYVPPQAVSVTAATPQPPAPPGSATGTVARPPAPPPSPQAAGLLPGFRSALALLISTAAAVLLLHGMWL